MRRLTSSVGIGGADADGADVDGTEADYVLLCLLLHLR